MSEFTDMHDRYIELWKTSTKIEKEKAVSFLKRSGARSSMNEHARIEVIERMRIGLPLGFK